MINVGYQEGNKGWEGEGGVIISSSLYTLWIEAFMMVLWEDRSPPCVRKTE